MGAHGRQLHHNFPQIKFSQFSALRHLVEEDWERETTSRPAFEYIVTSANLTLHDVAYVTPIPFLDLRWYSTACGKIH